VTGTIIRLHRGMGTIAVPAGVDADDVYRFVRAGVAGHAYDQLQVGVQVDFRPIRLPDPLHRGMAAEVRRTPMTGPVRGSC
jgi:hypothetical protein